MVTRRWSPCARIQRGVISTEGGGECAWRNTNATLHDSRKYIKRNSAHSCLCPAFQCATWHGGFSGEVERGRGGDRAQVVVKTALEEIDEQSRT